VTVRRKQRKLREPTFNSGRTCYWRALRLPQSESDFFCRPRCTQQRAEITGQPFLARLSLLLSGDFLRCSFDVPQLQKVFSHFVRKYRLIWLLSSLPKPNPVGVSCGMNWKEKAKEDPEPIGHVNGGMHRFFFWTAVTHWCLAAVRTILALTVSPIGHMWTKRNMRCSTVQAQFRASSLRLDCPFLRHTTNVGHSPDSSPQC